MGLAEQIEHDLDDRLRAVRGGLDRAGQLIADHMRDLVAVPGGPGRHAPPGDPPYRQTGALYASIRHAVTGDTLTVRCDADHAAYLEHGTRRLAPRPFFGRAIEETAAQVHHVLFEGG